MPRPASDTGPVRAGSPGNVPTVLLASRNPGKLRELRPIFENAGLRVIDLDEAGLPELPDEDAIEAFDTFEENAQAKARHFQLRSALPTVADDSGLEVRALHGEPGVRSKRWSGRTDLNGQALDDANNARLRRSIEQMDDRRARYVCVAAYDDGTRTIAARGEVEGLIVNEPRGSLGFGYDPYFYSTELSATFGESDIDDKERVSHRGRAFRSLLRELASTTVRAS